MTLYYKLLCMTMTHFHCKMIVYRRARVCTTLCTVLCMILYRGIVLYNNIMIIMCVYRVCHVRVHVLVYPAVPIVYVCLFTCRSRMWKPIMENNSTMKMVA